MTNDLAIRILSGAILGTTEQTHEAVAMEIKALSALPSASDLIDRQAAIKNAHLPVIDDAGYEVVRVDDILALPSAQPTEASCWGCNCPKMEILKEQKTLDVVEVIRCKDCYWYMADGACARHVKPFSPDDFCSQATKLKYERGERNDDVGHIE